VLHRIREIDAARKRCEALGATFATAETPATDAIWIRFRNEESQLASLVAFDVELATGSIRARDAARALEANAFDDGALAPLETELIALERAFSRRSALLKSGL
ncbi:MAG: hypothetical protein IAI49_05845, partial [Candidatus Eremiobacteraeota bacterium]|nr:hypothetical protein [Candidatus Eremiobacteraeota bacterium]